MYFGEFCYRSSSCIGKSTTLIFISSWRNEFTLLYQNSVTDVSVGFRPPCWCSSWWAPAWRLHTNLYKSLNISPDISSYVNLGEVLHVFTSFHFPDSGLYLLNGFNFISRSILNGVTLKTSNR